MTELNAAAGETNHLWPQFLPDGRHYLFIVGGHDNTGLYVGELGSSARTKLLGLKDLGTNTAVSNTPLPATCCSCATVHCWRNRSTSFGTC